VNNRTIIYRDKKVVGVFVRFFHCDRFNQQRGCPPFLLIKGTCAQTQYKIPYFLPAVRSIEYRVGSVLSTKDPVQNFKRQFEASLAKKRELFTNGIKVENAPPWHSAQVFVTDKPTATVTSRTVMHASPSGDIKEETNWPDSRVF
jgi:hypothetical protein